MITALAPSVLKFSNKESPTSKSIFKFSTILSFLTLEKIFKLVDLSSITFDKGTAFILFIDKYSLGSLTNPTILISSFFKTVCEGTCVVSNFNLLYEIGSRVNEFLKTLVSSSRRLNKFPSLLPIRFGRSISWSLAVSSLYE